MSPVHLPSLTLENFRGIRSLEIPELGRVTLLAGENGIGKTTVLEAIRVFASRGEKRSLTNLVESRGELLLGFDENGDEVLLPDFASLFHEIDRENKRTKPPVIGISAKPAPHNLSLRLFSAAESGKQRSTVYAEDAPIKHLRVTVGKRRREYEIDNGYTGFRRLRHRLRQVRRDQNPEGWPVPITHESLGPDLLHNFDIARLWDSVALTDAAEFVTSALRLVVGEEVDGVAVISDSSQIYGASKRRVIVKLKSVSVPVPLERLGTGAHRFLEITLALAKCRGGVLLIDEVENGIHYLIQPTLWKLIFKAASEGDVQVIAATHSWDCVTGFAEAAAESPEFGILYRLEKSGDSRRAVRYSEDDLDVAAQQRIEVR